MSTVEGRVALVTGASSGIGAATAKTLAGLGAKVALASRRGGDEGIAGALARSCDVRDPDQLERLVAETIERFGRLDIVVANAGVGAYGDFLDISAEHLDEMIDVNVKGLLYTVRACLPHLLESAAADLVVVASIAGQRAPGARPSTRPPNSRRSASCARSTTSCTGAACAARRSPQVASGRSSRWARAAAAPPATPTSRA